MSASSSSTSDSICEWRAESLTPFSGMTCALAEGVKLASVKDTVEGVVDEGLETIDKITDRVVAGKLRVF